MSKLRGFLCGVPDDQCSGSKLVTDQKFKVSKVHATHQAAFTCMKRYLIRVKGYTCINSREFHKEGEPVLLLPKMTKFGGELRAGKNIKGEGKRLMPKGKGNRGLIY